MVGEHCTRITIWHKQRIGHESATSVSAYPAFVAHSTVIWGWSTWGCSGRSSRCRRGRRRKHVVGVLHGSKKSWKTKKISPLRYQGLNKHVRTLSTSGSFNFWDSCCCSLLHGTVNNAFWKINFYFFFFFKWWCRYFVIQSISNENKNQNKISYYLLLSHKIMRTR